MWLSTFRVALYTQIRDSPSFLPRRYYHTFCFQYHYGIPLPCCRNHPHLLFSTQLRDSGSFLLEVTPPFIFTSCYGILGCQGHDPVHRLSVNPSSQTIVSCSYPFNPDEDLMEIPASVSRNSLLKIFFGKVCVSCRTCFGARRGGQGRGVGSGGGEGG